jgi:hypothetical protein
MNPGRASFPVKKRAPGMGHPAPSPGVWDRPDLGLLGGRAQFNVAALVCLVGQSPNAVAASLALWNEQPLGAYSYLMAPATGSGLVFWRQVVRPAWLPNSRGCFAPALMLVLRAL